MMINSRSLLDSVQPLANLSLWLAGKGFWGNPFERWNAEQDPGLPNYFVDIGGFDELFRLTEPCVVFAPRGCGKTAQRQMLAAQCRPLKHGGRRLALAYTYDEFEQVLGCTDNNIYQVQASHHVRAILNLGVRILSEEAERDPKIRDAWTDTTLASRWVTYTERATPQFLNTNTVGTSRSLKGLGSRRLLEEFARLIRDLGLESCLVLVDGLDEFPLTASDPVQAVTFLAPLLGTLALVECPGFAFKFFLPQELEQVLRPCGWFRADRLHFFRIAWTSTAWQKWNTGLSWWLHTNEQNLKGVSPPCENPEARSRNRFD